MTDRETMTVPEAAARLGVTRQAIHARISSGDLAIVGARPQRRRADGTWAEGGLLVRVADVEGLARQAGELPSWVPVALGPGAAMVGVAAWSVLAGLWLVATIALASAVLWAVLVRGFADLDREGACWSCGRQRDTNRAGLCDDCASLKASRVPREW